jgi:excisionase family DNA binding protein
VDPGSKDGRVSTAAADTLLTVSDLAARLRLKPAAVRALTRRGEIAFYRVGRSIRFDEADVDAYLERQRRPARGDRSLSFRTTTLV